MRSLPIGRLAGVVALLGLVAVNTGGTDVATAAAVAPSVGVRSGVVLTQSMGVVDTGITRVPGTVQRRSL
jgi:hypothetical protein